MRARMRVTASCNKAEAPGHLSIGNRGTVILLLAGCGGEGKRMSSALMLSSYTPLGNPKRKVW
jgi:hypothetical protein